MTSPTEPIGSHRADGDISPVNLPEKAAVARELESILSSPFFRTTRRSKQFLAYVVQHKLEGKQVPLKERMIGADLFQRPAGYATGDDPVVRVQAGDVRRRLEQYYHAAPGPSLVRIELPVGSYTPEFRWAQAAQTQEESPLAAQAATDAPAETRTSPTRRNYKWLAWAGLILASLLAVALIGISSRRARVPLPPSALKQFWSPVFATTDPILICMAKPTVYRPSPDLYRRHSGPNQFRNELERLSQPPPLQRNDKLVWGDMVEYPDFGVARGDAYAAIRFSALLGRLGKDSQVRIGDNYSFEDLRSFPAIVIGAFNNRWAIQLTSNLHFTFVDENGNQMIREQGQPGRSWHTKWDPHGTGWLVAEDYGVVTRLVDSKTGKFVVAAAGLTANGTQAVSEFVTSPEYLEKALRNAPPGWAQKNLQIVVQTTVTDSVPGPPQVVATYIW